jgi:hypothetical protein
MRRAGLALALTLLPGTLAAQEARLRSGEHEGFSRLVVYMPEPAEIETAAGDRRFEIAFDARFGFETSDVFYYIPRTRIADIAAEPGRLVLDLACDCAVNVERLSPEIVYLDVADAGDAPASAPAREAATPGPRPMIRLPIQVEPAAATLLPGGLAVAPAPAVVEMPVTPPRQPSGTAAAVAEQVARAANQGLLDPDGVLPAAEAPAEAGPADPAPEPMTQPAVPGETAPRRHVSIRNGIDESLGRRFSDVLEGIGPVGHCLPDESFDVAAWAPEGAAEIARLRAEVVGPTDRPDARGIADLARGYVALTFGAEAQQAIRTAGVPVPGADVLLPMAEIVDHGVATEPGPLAGQYDCPGASALWAVLSRPAIPDAAEIDADALTLAFGALPPAMRRHLGPALAQRLIDHGAADAAAVIRSAIGRAPGATTVETALLDASIAADAGRDAAADAALGEIVEATSGRSAEAVERLIRRRLDAGEPVAADLLAAADALIFEHRGTPLAERLSVLKIEALARGGQPQRALAFLADAEDARSEADAARLRGIAYAEATGQLEDPAFLLLAVRAGEALADSPDEMAARRAVARRLVEMELYGLAETLGVEEGRVADTAGRPGPPAPLPTLPLPAAQDLPGADQALQRSAALLERSAALRQTLDTALARDAGAE